MHCQTSAGRWSRPRHQRKGGPNLPSRPCLGGSENNAIGPAAGIIVPAGIGTAGDPVDMDARQRR
eukprot:8234-Eustigmatos_ZCMA.PRE.1